MERNMHMKTSIMKQTSLILVLCSLLLTGCKDYLTAPEPAVTQISEFYINSEAAIQNVTACYVPLMWEFNKTYYSEWFIGDVVSDDALKGGQSTTDMSDVYDLENWKTTTNNQLLLDFYQAQYQGVARCNLALKYISEMETDDDLTPSLKNRLLGEAYFLRAYYYFRLLRVFGGVPLTTEVLDEASKWEMPRATIAEVFKQIESDLKQANSKLWLRSKYAVADLGRATKGAAQAMLLKVNLYKASPYWCEKISGDAVTFAKAAKAWGDSIVASGEYSLNASHADNFLLANENSVESVFEIQYAEVPWGDYGDNTGGNGFTAGTFTPILTRSRSSLIGGGWGFNHPTQNLYNEFEEGDARREVAIFIPDDAKMENPVEETYLGSKMLNNKYAMYDKYPNCTWPLHATRGPINNKQIRYADVLLMRAEAALIAEDDASAEADLNTVRARAGLGSFGSYKFSVNGTEITSPTLKQAIRHERRMELAMEGHRWFDLVRWGDTKAHMDAYAATETAEAKSHMATFVAGKHELFPIPATERELNPALTQNEGYN